MEYDLRGIVRLAYQLDNASLNPYSNGIWSTSIHQCIVNHKSTSCLNPYSNGIWSTRRMCWMRTATRLLSLNPYSNGIWSTRYRYNSFSINIITVLILILMEYDLRVQQMFKGDFSCVKGLNPYSNGIWSTSVFTGSGTYKSWKVLILILMEYDLRDYCLAWKARWAKVWILILLEDTLWDSTVESL